MYVFFLTIIHTVHVPGLVPFENYVSCCGTSATTIENMFRHATSFSGGDLSGWADCLYNVQNANRMFRGATSLSGTVAGWNFLELTDMEEMFYNCYCKPDVGEWWVGKVTNMKRSFLSSGLEADISGWDGTLKPCFKIVPMSVFLLTVASACLL